MIDACKNKSANKKWKYSNQALNRYPRKYAEQNKTKMKKGKDDSQFEFEVGLEKKR